MSANIISSPSTTDVIENFGNILFNSTLRTEFKKLDIETIKKRIGVSEENDEIFTPMIENFLNDKDIL